MKNDFPTSFNWLDSLIVHADSGYQGLESDYSVKTALLPFKRKKNEPELCELKKAYNRKLAKWRIYVEHAIGGMKRYRILVERIRLKSIDEINTIIEVCAGLWNLRVKVREEKLFNVL